MAGKTSSRTNRLSHTSAQGHARVTEKILPVLLKGVTLIALSGGVAKLEPSYTKKAITSRTVTHPAP